MKRLVAVMAFALLVGAQSQTDSTAGTGNALVEYCSFALDPHNTGFRGGYCFGFVSGIAFEDSDIELPAGVTTGQLVRVVAKYLDDHPEKLHYQAGILMEEALRKAYPRKRQQ